MNKKLSMAVAAAVLAFGASAANAGIVIPAGDWTVDINGNVNAFYIHNSSRDTNLVAGGLANTKGANGTSSSSINTGLLPSWFGVTGKKRENDLDISWTISYQPGASSNHALSGGSGSEFRQANLTFGDKSWGTVKVGKDLGLFGSDAILNDQTLLGVGSQGVVGTKGGTTTTLGRIGTGFLYADFTGQIEYSSPNWSGFQFNAEIAQPWNTFNLASSGTASGNQKAPAFEGNVNYSWAGDISGKVWLEDFYQRVYGVVGANTPVGGRDVTANVWALGGKVGVSGFEAVAYYYDGRGVGTTGLLMDGFDTAGKKRDSNGGYIQLAYKIPTVGTKLAASWGESKLDNTSQDKLDGNTALVNKNEMWTVGAYHPLTSNLNLVAEYSHVKADSHGNGNNRSNIVDFGAILFF